MVHVPPTSHAAQPTIEAVEAFVLIKGDKNPQAALS